MTQYPAPIYAAWASTDEYPSLDSVEELNDFCERDIRDVKLTARLDGQDLFPDQIKIDKPFSVDLPVQNILGLKVPGKRGKRTIIIVSNGYWIWLKPLGWRLETTNFNFMDPHRVLIQN